MKPLNESKAFAARMGRWSANHWKTAVFGWLAFVVGVRLREHALATVYIDENDANVGESRTADRILDEAGFIVERAGRDGRGARRDGPRPVEDPHGRRRRLPCGRRGRRADPATPFPRPGRSSRRSAPATPTRSRRTAIRRSSRYAPHGTYEEAILYIDEHVAAIDEVADRHPAFGVESLGTSTDKALDAEIKGGLAKAGLISIPLTTIVLLFILGSLVAALIPLLLGVTAVVATMGLLAIASQGIPVSENIMEVVLLVGLAVGVDYSLFYMKRERQERAAGRPERAALEAAAATSGRAVLVSGITVLIAMAGMFLSGDKTFMSFSVGAMLVVFVAMIGSLTVLPAILGRLGDKVEKGRIPFLGRRRGKQTESRLWSAVLDRVLRRPRRLGARRRCRAGRAGAADAPAPHLPDRHRGDHQPGGRAVRAAHGRLPGHA